jgi:hypothetical protein
MTTSKIIWLVILSLGFAVCGWLCVFRTNMLVTWGRRPYEKSKFVRAYPFSNIVMKPWYPTYIRCAGIFIWLWALAVIYLVTMHNFR